MAKKISGVNGMDSYTVNSGEILNRGYNVSLTMTPVQFKDFRWSLSTSISKTFNRVETKPSTDQYDVEHFLDGTVITKGNPVSIQGIEPGGRGTVVLRLQGESGTFVRKKQTRYFHHGTRGFRLARTEAIGRYQQHVYLQKFPVKRNVILQSGSKNPIIQIIRQPEFQSGAKREPGIPETLATPR